MTEPEQASHHPIGLIVNDDLHRNRATVFFRYFLAIPQIIWLVLWTWAMYVVIPISWLVAVILGRLPVPLHSFIGHYLRASTHIRAYTLLLANPWPPFLGVPGSYVVDVRIDPAVQQSRLKIFVRGLLGVPAMLIAFTLAYVVAIFAFLGWWYSLVFGRMHEGMRDAGAWMFRYEVQTYAYLGLLAERYPSLEGAPTA